MGLSATAKRWVYLTHRWTGIFGCLLMLLWFISGIIMLYVGYPKLTPWERFGVMPALEQKGCCVNLGELTQQTTENAITLTSIRGTPHYVISDQAGTRTFNATNGAFIDAITPDLAVAEAIAFSGESRSTYADAIQEDRWTHSRGLDRHRPLHKVEVPGDHASTLYISSSTGQIVLDAPRSQQYWNYPGAWLHWLYMFRTTSTDPFWTWLVIILSGICTLSALAGLLVGIWRWRFQGRYKSGSHSPYREPWMRWHHIIGLVFSLFVCTWIFSGLMSVNPGGIFSSDSTRPDIASYRGAPTELSEPLADTSLILQTLRDTGFMPVELRWLRLGGENYVLAFDNRAQTRVARAQNDTLLIQDTWSPDALADAASNLFQEPMTNREVVTAYDVYYYQRHPEAMNGATKYSLPALSLKFQDPSSTTVYIDMRTGEVASSFSSAQRANRWLFYFLHSWDTPALLNAGRVREAALILLSLGGTALCITGVVIGWRRLRESVRKPKPRKPKAG